MFLNNYIKSNSKLIKFLIVWSSSTIIDVVFLYIFYDLLSFQLLISVTLSFLLSVLNWFILNKFWTFQDKSTKHKRQFIKFLFVSIWGLLFTLFFMYLFTHIIWIYYIISKLLTSFIVVVWNFLLNKHWTFKIKTTWNNFYKKPEYKFSIIIPCFNEEKRIWNTLIKIDKFMKQKNCLYEILVVDDWSKDKSIEIINALYLDNLRIIENKKNKWKWFSVRRWVLESNWKYILFTDADNSTPIEELDKLYNFMKLYDIAIWSRYCKDAVVKIKQTKFRQNIWRIWNLLIRYFLIDWINDTQCWFKLFKNKVAKKLFSIQKINWFWFDMEILLAWKSMWYKIKEVPVSWYNSDISRLRPIRDSLKTFLELLFIKMNYWFDWYK